MSYGQPQCGGSTLFLFAAATANSILFLDSAR
jgi:hypothetical protein